MEQIANYCEMKNVAALSVNKGYCTSPVTTAVPDSELWRKLRMETGAAHCHAGMVREKAGDCDQTVAPWGFGFQETGLSCSETQGAAQKGEELRVP